MTTVDLGFPSGRVETPLRLSFDDRMASIREDVQRFDMSAHI